MAGGIVHIPWYATLFRGDRFERAVAEIAPIAMRYGATRYEVRRSETDAYKILQTATFLDHADFYAYWEGPEFNDFRSRYSSWFQVPIVYEWHREVIVGELNGNGNGNGGSGSHAEPAPMSERDPA